MIEVDEGCGFCVELNHLDCENNLFEKLVRPNSGLLTRIVLETENFAVMPTIGAFVEGYLLIVSKHHYNCIGQMPLSIIDELDLLIEKVKKLIWTHYHKSVVCFEHGSISCSNKFGGCIDHAHLHVVPCGGAENFIQTIEKCHMNIQCIETLRELNSLAEEKLPYLYWEDIDQQKYLISADIIPSQFFRQIIAGHYGVIEQWDWRQHYFIDNIEKTVRELTQ